MHINIQTPGQVEILIPICVISASPNVLDFHNKVTTSETLISDYKVRSQVCNNVKSSLIMVYYLY